VPEQDRDREGAAKEDRDRKGAAKQNRDREGAAKEDRGREAGTKGPAAQGALAEGRAGKQPLADARGSVPLADGRGSVPLPLPDARGSVSLADARGSGRRDKSIPLAYLITFRTYGTWLHGDARGSVDRTHNIYGAPLLPPDGKREQAARRRCRQAPVKLDAAQRRIVRQAVVEVSERQEWSLHELNVRSNHVHVVVSAPEDPDRVVNTFKSISTRRLRDAGLIDASIKPWNRGASRKYLWTPDALKAACRYVLDGQGPDI
jgi:REP element-mobilizing transposase RayT